MKFALALVLTVTALMGTGCILDENGGNSDDKTAASRISDLTMGGGVFFFPKEGYAIAQFGTFNGTDPFEDARVFVNGVELQNQSGRFSNAQPLDASLIDTGSPVRVAVYALGDSVVHSISLPEAPSILRPEEGAQLAVGDSLLIEIDYPGPHQIVSMSLSNQANVATAVETSQTRLTLPVPGSYITAAGESILTAISSNASGDIPSEFDINDQYRIFLVSTVVNCTVTFVE